MSIMNAIDAQASKKDVDEIVDKLNDKDKEKKKDDKKNDDKKENDKKDNDKNDDKMDIDKEKKK